MPTLLPLDSNNAVIPALRLRDGGAHSIAATSASAARNTQAFSAQTRIVSLYASEPVYVKFGNAGVSAETTDHFYPAGVYYDFSVGGGSAAHYTHVSVRAVSADAFVYISEKE